MGAYVVRRLIAMLLMLVALSMIVFLLFNALPADPARLTCGKACTPDVIEANRVRLGLDKPLYEQYAVFVKGIFAGRTYGSGTATFECATPCLGYSFRRGEEVTGGPNSGGSGARSATVRPTPNPPPKNMGSR